MWEELMDKAGSKAKCGETGPLRRALEEKLASASGTSKDNRLAVWGNCKKAFHHYVAVECAWYRDKLTDSERKLHEKLLTRWKRNLLKTLDLPEAYPPGTYERACASSVRSAVDNELFQKLFNSHHTAT